MKKNSGIIKPSIISLNLTEEAIRLDSELSSLRKNKISNYELEQKVTDLICQGCLDNIRGKKIVLVESRYGLYFHMYCHSGAIDKKITFKFLGFEGEFMKFSVYVK